MSFAIHKKMVQVVAFNDSINLAQSLLENKKKYLAKCFEPDVQQSATVHSKCNSARETLGQPHGTTTAFIRKTGLDI
jgi:hypothetical protein